VHGFESGVGSGCDRFVCGPKGRGRKNGAIYAVAAERRVGTAEICKFRGAAGFRFPGWGKVTWVVVGCTSMCHRHSCIRRMWGCLVSRLWAWQVEVVREREKKTMVLSGIWATCQARKSNLDIFGSVAKCGGQVVGTVLPAI